MLEEQRHDVDKVNSINMNKPIHFILNSSNTKTIFSLFVTVIQKLVRLNLLQRTTPTEGISIQLAKLHQQIGEHYEVIMIMHIRIIYNSEKTQIFIMNNVIINSQFIGSQQTHLKRRLHRIELQGHQGEHGIKDQRERRSHLATSYGSIGLW